MMAKLHYVLYHKLDMICIRPSSYPTNWWDEKFTKTIFQQEKTIILNGKTEPVIVAIRLNPTDKRGFRTIVSAQGRDDPRLLFNMEITQWYTSGLYTLINDLTGKFTHFLATLGFFPQISLAGNNSHGEEDGQFVLGTGEPNFLHFHVIGRQVNGFNCGCGIPLIVPNPGELFDMRVGKIKYETGEHDCVMHFMRDGFTQHFSKF